MDIPIDDPFRPIYRDEELGWILAAVAQFIAFVIGILFYFAGKSTIKKIKKLISGEKQIAHWSFSGNVWQTYTHAEIRRQMADLRKNIIIIFFIGPLVGCIKEPEHWLTTGLILSGVLCGLVFMVQYPMIAAYRKRSDDPPYEVYFSPISAYLNGSYYEWSNMGTRLVKAEILNDPDSQIPSLLITYAVRGRYGEEEKKLYVPIPPDKMDEAQNIVPQFC
jgi:hypothetical protein